MSPIVHIVIGRRGPLPHERYVIAVYSHANGADTRAASWRRQYPAGVVDVEHYTVIDGHPADSTQSESSS